MAGFPDHGMTRASAAMMEQETIAAIRGLEGAARKRPQSPMAPPEGVHEERDTKIAKQQPLTQTEAAQNGGYIDMDMELTMDMNMSMNMQIELHG